MKRCYNFGPDQAAAIDRLSAELGIKKTAVLHIGLRLLRHAVQETRQGNRLGVVNGDRVVGRLVGEWDQVAIGA